MFVVEVKVKGVVGVFGVVRVAPIGLFPGDDLAHIFDHLLALGDGLNGEHALAMHARTTGLNATTRWGQNGGVFGQGQNSVNLYTCTCVRARARARGAL